MFLICNHYFDDGRNYKGSLAKREYRGTKIIRKNMLSFLALSWTHEASNGANDVVYIAVVTKLFSFTNKNLISKLLTVCTYE